MVDICALKPLTRGEHIVESQSQSYDDTVYQSTDMGTNYFVINYFLNYHKRKLTGSHLLESAGFFLKIREPGKSLWSWKLKLNVLEKYHVIPYVNKFI